MEAGIIAGIKALLSADNIAIVALAVLVVVLLWLLISERKRSERAWSSHAELLHQNNEVLGAIAVTMEVLKDRMR